MGKKISADPMRETGKVKIKNIDQVIATMPLNSMEKHFLLTRWLTFRNMHKKRGTMNGLQYRMIGLTKVLCGVLVPVTISSMGLFSGHTMEKLLQHGAIALSIMGTLAIALEDFFQFGVRAKTRKVCQNKMDRDFWEFHALAGPYMHFSEWSGPAFQRFVRNVEKTMYAAEKAHASMFMQDDDDGGGGGGDKKTEAAAKNDLQTATTIDYRTFGSAGAADTQRSM